MHWRVSLTIVLAWILTVPLSLVHAEQTLQQRYLDIFLKINDAEHLVQQNDYRGALDDFQDCYNKLAKIHDSDPDWETALVVHRMDDCKRMILELQPKADAQVATQPAAPVAPAPSPDYDTNPPSQPASSDDVAALKLQLQAVTQELQITKANLADSQAQLETYRTQLQAVNGQLAALKAQPSVDDRMAKLLNENKTLTDKLASTQKELDAYKSNPKSKLALAEAQLKNLQDQYDASQEANKALQDTTTTLKQQLDQANADLVAANQKLADVGTGSPEYQTIKRENEVMREILTQELQEQAHRDMAKRLAQEEFDNLKLKSKVLQEQLDILGSPMTPATTDEQRALLASLKVPGPSVDTPTDGNSFVAQASGSAPSTDPTTTTNPPSAPAQTPSTPDTNAASATPPAATTNMASDTPPDTNSMTATTPPSATDNSTNQPPVTIAMNNQASPGEDTPTPPAMPDASITHAPTSITPAAAPTGTPDPTTPPATTPAPANNVPDPNAPIPPNTPTGQPAASPVAANPDTPAAPATPPSSTGDTNTVTTTHLPAATTVVQDTTITHGDSAAPPQNDPTEYSTKARLPDDMRETAQDAADLFKNQKYDESAAKYQSIIDKYPESLYAWSNLGVVRFQQGKFDEALKALQQAVKLSPTDAFSYSNLGIVYYQLNQYENAIDALNSAKALDPNDAKTHNYLGCACSQKGWQEVAEKEFRKAIEIDPNFGDAHFNLALVYATSKPPSLELARREYNRALELGIAKDLRLEKLLGEPEQ
jgi:Tfp pilus assembly protein PilF